MCGHVHGNEILRQADIAPDDRHDLSIAASRRYRNEVSVPHTAMCGVKGDPPRTREVNLSPRMCRTTTRGCICIKEVKEPSSNIVAGDQGSFGVFFCVPIKADVGLNDFDSTLKVKALLGRELNCELNS